MVPLDPLLAVNVVEVAHNAPPPLTVTVVGMALMVAVTAVLAADVQPEVVFLA
jgi:hypothetical protein